MDITIKSLYLSMLLSPAVANKDLCIKTRLLHDLLDDYEADLLPDKHLPIKVGLDVSVLSINDLDDARQSLDINIWVQVLWHDHRLRWNISEYGGNNVLHLSSHRIWVPDLTPIGSAGSLSSSKVRVYADGAVQMQFGTSVAFLCQLDMANFPFDVQMCPMKISSYSYNSSFLHLFNLSRGAHLTEFKSNGEWKIHSVPVCEDSTDYTGVSHLSEEFSGLNFIIILERRGLYYIFNIVLPCVLITMVSHTVFLLPPESGERISMGLTVLLSLCVFLTVVAEQLPATSKTIPLIGQYFVSTIILLSVTCVLTVLILNVHHRSNTTLPAAITVVVIQGLGTILCVDTGRRKEGLKDTNSTRTTEQKATLPASENPDLTDHENNTMTEKKWKDIVSESREEQAMDQTGREGNSSSPKDDWKLVARILDRFFFIVLFAANMLCTVCILTHREPVTKAPCVPAYVMEDFDWVSWKLLQSVSNVS